MDTPITEAEWWIVVISIVMLAAVGFGIGYAILRSARYPQPTLLVMALSMLTLLTIAAFLATREAELLTLTGVGLGALAGAVNAVFGNRSQSPATSEDTEPPEPATGGDPGNDGDDSGDMT